MIQKQQRLIEELENERQNLLAQKAEKVLREGNDYLEQSARVGAAGIEYNAGSR